MNPSKIFNVEQIRRLDAFTIINEPIGSIDLMERACHSFVKWFTNHFDSENPVRIFAGLGNNGGDGLAIARLLANEDYPVEVNVIWYAENTTADFKVNYERLPQGVVRKDIRSIDEINSIQLNTTDKNTIIVDALLGSGLSRKPEGLLEKIIQYINQSSSRIVSVDIASGLYADRTTDHTVVVNPNFTVAFQIPKLAFLLPENSKRVGEWKVVDIGLSSQFIEEEKTNKYLIDRNLIKSIYKKRNKFSHKGNFGRALLVAGSYGKMGTAVLAANGCLRAGVGLLTIQVPKCGVEILQTSVPEAMVISGKSKKAIEPLEWESLQPDAIGIGPGIGKNAKALACLGNILQETETPMVIDADAINLLAENSELLNIIPPNSILTPHVKEFERLAGKAKNDFARIDRLQTFAVDQNLYIVLKGAHTAIATPHGDIYFNTTGNPGMATGGSGDVLTGILTSLLAQGYLPLDACILGVYLHGLAGDLAAKDLSEESLIASDIVQYLGKAFLSIVKS
jgi:NAD(P)H-hydrate epimerase